MKIIARKPKDNAGNEYIVVERANGEFVSATANPQSLAHGEWFWGHYFTDRDGAMAHFNARRPLIGISLVEYNERWDVIMCAFHCGWLSTQQARSALASLTSTHVWR